MEVYFNWDQLQFYVALKSYIHKIRVKKVQYRCGIKSITKKALIILSTTILLSGCGVKNSSEREVTRSQYGFAGSGTEADPYIVGNADDLIHLRDMVNAGESFNSQYFFQTADIDLSCEDNWVPIGIFGSNNYFSGFYNGGGHVIGNLVCVRDGENVGLFGLLDGEVRNLGIEGSLISGGCVGAIASHGSENAIILNCYNKADVFGLYRASGIVDNSLGQVLFCFNSGDITSSVPNSAAGVVSYNCKRMVYCFSTTAPVTNYNFVGELIKSRAVNIMDVDAEFLQKRYQAMQNWDSLFMESDKTAQMKLVNGDIELTEMQLISEESQLFELQISVIVLSLLIFIVITFDFFINVKTRRHTKKNCC